MLVKVFGAAVQGIDAKLITIEVNCSRGIRFLLVGLPDTSVKESHERIVSALQVNGLKFPRQQVVINMSPADIRKEGSAYDLPLAVGILAASGSVKPDRLSRYLLMGDTYDAPGDQEADTADDRGGIPCHVKFQRCVRMPWPHEHLIFVQRKQRRQGGADTADNICAKSCRLFLF